MSVKISPISHQKVGYVYISKGYDHKKVKLELYRKPRCLQSDTLRLCKIKDEDSSTVGIFNIATQIFINKLPFFSMYRDRILLPSDAYWIHLLDKLLLQMGGMRRFHLFVS